MHDSHIHLTIEPLYSYREQALDTFISSGGKFLLNTSNDIENCYKTLEVYREFKHKYPNLIQNTVGIHPEEYNSKELFSHNHENVKKDLNELEKILSENREEIHAIGECGLEYFNLLDRNDLSFDEKEEIVEMQKMSFRGQIHLAIENNLPMTIHTRDEMDSEYCIQDTINILAAEGKMQVRGCMHCYVGKIDYLQTLLEMGLSIGFNAILTYKSGENVRELLKHTPLEKILLETDAPFLPPDSVRKNKKETIRFGQPIDILEIAKAVSEIKGIGYEKVIEVTNENYKNLFIP